MGGAGGVQSESLSLELDCALLASLMGLPRLLANGYYQITLPRFVLLIARKTEDEENSDQQMS